MCSMRMSVSLLSFYLLNISGCSSGDGKIGKSEETNDADESNQPRDDSEEKDN